MQINWEWLNTVNAWQSIATIGFIITGLFVITRFLIRFWPWLKKTIALTEALGELPAFMNRTDEAIRDIRHEVKFNNGSSVKDAVRRVELNVRELHTKMDDQKTAFEAADELIRQELADTVPAPVKPSPRPQSRRKPKEKLA